MYAVEWSDEAVEDLTARVRSRDVALELYEVSKHALNGHFKPWGGSSPPLYWRRGVLPWDEDAYDRRGSVGSNGPAEQAWNYVLIYKRRPVRLIPTPLLYLVLGVASNTDYVDVLTKLG